jgi:hypothetical protein
LIRCQLLASCPCHTCSCIIDSQLFTFMLLNSTTDTKDRGKAAASWC